MAETLEKISTLSDMKALMAELQRLEQKFLYDFYGALQDFSSKKILPQLLAKKKITNVFISEKGTDIFKKVSVSKRYSVIVYDLESVDMNGLEFLAELEKNSDAKSRCKVIMAIPKLNSDAQMKLKQLGAASFVFKPIEAEALRLAFEKIGVVIPV
ncbi:MAG: response regulator [Fibromonadales bacterium]|nr:response regulator [Fibromonadales bacterium]